MKNNILKKYRGPLKIIGAVLVTVIVGYAWYRGFLAGIFYLFGFYMALYLIARIFKTEIILQFILGAGVFLLYVITGLVDLWILYNILGMLFGGEFMWGVLMLVLGLPLINSLAYLIVGAIGFVLGAPLYWMINDLESRKSKVVSAYQADLFGEDGSGG